MAAHGKHILLHSVLAQFGSELDNFLSVCVVHIVALLSCPIPSCLNKLFSVVVALRFYYSSLTQTSKTSKQGEEDT